MKKLLILIILAMFLLVSCDDELPPSPPPPGGDVAIGRAMAGMAGAMPKWAAEPKNIAVTPPNAYYNDGVVVSISNFDYVYSTGYLFNSKLRTWEKFNLQGDQVESWLKGQGIGSVVIDQNKFADGDNYLVVYACTRSGKEWECNGKRWMLVTFKVLGSATGAIPELANLDQMVINAPINPFVVIGSTAEKDNFLDVNVIRYDAKYREPSGLVVLVHVFDFNTRAEVDKTLEDPNLFRPIIVNGFKNHLGNSVSMFLDENDHRVAVWSSGKKIIYVETFDKASGNKEIIESYLNKYPSDLKKLT